MRIEITDNTKMRTALSLAYKRSYFEALCLFAQVESYESALNQIACLAEMQDVGYAVDAYYYAKQKYGNTHAVYADICLLGDVAESIAIFCETNQRAAVANDGKLRADKALLAKFCKLEPEDDFAAPDLNYAADSTYFDASVFSPNNFYDVKSTRYFDSLRINMEKCLMYGNEKQAKKYAKRLLEIKTDHLPTLEAQISLILYSEKFHKGLQYAKRLAQAEGGSHAAIGGAIDIVTYLYSPKYFELLDRLLHKAAEVIEDITLFDLEDYIYLSTSRLHNYQLANLFAEALYKNFRNASLEALHMCACAFYNCGNARLAKEASITLLRAVPKNTYARILAEYVREVPVGKNTLSMNLQARSIRHFCIPAEIALYAHDRLTPSLGLDDSTVINEAQLFYISVLVAYCKSLVLLNRRKEYSELIALLRAVLVAYDFQSTEAFLQFAKWQLIATMPDQCLNETLLYRLITLGVKEVLHVGLPTGYYKLDISGLDCCDEVFVRAFAICATLISVDEPRKYLKAYNDIFNTISIELQDETLPHKLAYALLRLCNKDFAEFPEAEFFAEGEDALYIMFRAAKRNKNEQ